MLDTVSGQCPYCGFAIGPREPRVVCGACGAAHHEGCWRNNGRCTTPNCTGEPVGASSNGDGAESPVPLGTPGLKPPPPTRIPARPDYEGTGGSTGTSSSFDLRPLDFRDILDETVELYKSNAWLFISIAATVYLPVYILSALFRFSAPNSYNPVGVLTGLAAPVVSAALAWAASERLLGRSTSSRASYAPVLRRFAAFILTQMLVWLALVALGLGLFFAAGIAVAFGMLGALLAVPIVMAGVVMMAVAGVWLSVTPQVQVLEGLHYTAAMGRSRALVQGYVAKTFGVLLVIGILTAIVTGLLLGIPTAIVASTSIARGLEMSRGTAVLLTVLEAAISIGMAPLQMIALTWVYYDLRARKEGFDLEMLAQALEAEATSARP
ncbi:MAG TPA: RING finger protein [Armatimonadota bacterium]